jgi:hypothetical protein
LIKRVRFDYRFDFFVVHGIPSFSFTVARLVTKKLSA